MATVSGVTTLDGGPVSTLVVVVSADVTNPAVLGQGVSDEVTGAYSITVNYTDEVMVFTMQDYGAEWSASATLAVDDVVHPATPNGYIYRVTQAGDTGTTEPTWPTTDGETIADGGVTYVTELLLEPKIAGYKKPTP